MLVRGREMMMMMMVCPVVKKVEGHQMINLSSYRSESFLFNKVSELVAALHTSLVCQALRRYTIGKKSDSLTAHGLHIHRTIGIIHIQLTLSKNTMEIAATYLVNGIVHPEVFCVVMKYFIDKLKRQ